MRIKMTLFNNKSKMRVYRITTAAVMLLTVVSFVMSLNSVMAGNTLPPLEFAEGQSKAECAQSVRFTTTSPIEGDQVCIYDSEELIAEKQTSDYVRAEKADAHAFTLTCKTEGNIIPKGNYYVTQATSTELGHIGEQSLPATITFYEPAQEKPSEADFSIDFISEKLIYSGMANVEYSINSDAYLPLEASLDISGFVSEGAEVSVKLRTAAALGKPPSEDIVFTIPKRPFPPEPPEMTVCDIRVIALKPTLGFEYKMEGFAWSEEFVFKDLIPDTEYSFFQRMKAVGDKSFITEQSEALIVKTSREKTISGTVTGTVSLPETTAKRLAGASVQLRSGGNNIGAAVVTDENGQYSIPVFANGYYTIIVKKSGYTTGETQRFYHLGENISDKDIRLEKTGDSGGAGEGSSSGSGGGGGGKPGDGAENIPPMTIWLHHSSVKGSDENNEKPSYKYKGKYIWEAE